MTSVKGEVKEGECDRLSELGVNRFSLDGRIVTTLLPAEQKADLQVNKPRDVVERKNRNVVVSGGCFFTRRGARRTAVF